MNAQRDFRLGNSLSGDDPEYDDPQKQTDNTANNGTFEEKH